MKKFDIVCTTNKGKNSNLSKVSNKTIEAKNKNEALMSFLKEMPADEKDIKIVISER